MTLVLKPQICQGRAFKNHMLFVPKAIMTQRAYPVLPGSAIPTSNISRQTMASYSEAQQALDNTNTDRQSGDAGPGQGRRANHLT